MVRFGGREVHLRVSGKKLILDGAEYWIPPWLVGSEPVIPIGPAARALGLRYWESSRSLRVAGLGAP